jgi:hypothetical protein
MQKKLTYTTIITALIIITFIVVKSFFSKPELKVKILNQWPGFTLDQLYMLNDILTENYNVKITNKNYDLVIDGVFGEEKEPDQTSIKLFFTGESIKPKLENYDLSMGFDYIDEPNYIRIPLYYMYYGPKVSTEYSRGTCSPDKKYFACFLVSHGGIDSEENEKKYDGCVARNRLFHKLSLYKKVASGGKFLNNIGKVVPNKETNEWLSKCKFVIAHENRSYEGYITEKPFQAYYAGAIPLYYSHPSAIKDINPNSIIYAPNFSSEDELAEYIKKVDNDDDLYCKIWNEKIITNPDRNYESVKAKLSEKLIPLITKKLKK